jgi:glycosyltransferase involved in cell wall biosynthesis
MLANQLDICIPAYNEGEIIVATLRAILIEANRHSEVECRLIVVDNASTDDTGWAAENVGNHRVSVVHIPKKGKELAIRTVALTSRAEYFAFIDADLSAGPEALFQLLAQLTEHGTDIVIGSRLLDETKIMRVWWRTLTSKIFNVVARLLVPVGVKDTQCGLKVMNAKGRNVLCECLESAWFFDIEFLAHARRSGLSIREVPVAWDEYYYPNRATKFNVWHEELLAIIAMVRIRSRISRQINNLQ